MLGQQIYDLANAFEAGRAAGTLTYGTIVEAVPLLRAVGAGVKEMERLTVPHEARIADGQALPDNVVRLAEMFARRGVRVGESSPEPGRAS